MLEFSHKIMKEIELKAHVSDRAQMLSRLQDNYKFIDHLINKDNYYKSDSATSDQVRLRLRQDSRRSYIIITSKVKTINNGIEVNDEAEFEINDEANFVKMLNMLGFKLSFSKHKDVYLFKKENISYELVNIEGLGDFIEIETLTDNENDVELLSNKVMQALLSLGVDKSMIESKSYKELLLEKDI